MLKPGTELPAGFSTLTLGVLLLSRESVDGGKGSMTAALVAKQTGLVFAGPVGTLDSYIDRVSQIPVLSKEDEIALAVKFRSESDLDAARQLVLSHLRSA